MLSGSGVVQLGRCKLRVSLIFLVCALSVSVAWAADWSTAHVDPTGGYMNWDTVCGGYTAVTDGDRRLMLSDNPETINTDNLNNVLWHDGSVGDTVSCPEKHHRVWLWHVNDANQSIKLGVTIKNRSETNTIELINCKGTTGTADSGFLTLGKDQAVTCLGGTWGSFTPDDSEIAADDIGIIQQWTVSDEYLRGAILDFTVRLKSGTGDLDYIIRTVACETGDSITNYVEAAVAKESTHARGSWGSCALKMDNDGDKFDANTDGELRLLVTWNQSGVNDWVYTCANSWDSSEAQTNKGNYGVAYELILYVTNTGGAQKTVDLRVTAQNTGGQYGGSGRVGTGSTYGIPPILWNTNEDGTQVVTSFVVDGSSTVSKTFHMMNAGAATMPVGLHFKTQ